MNIFTKLRQAVRKIALAANSDFPTMPVNFSHQPDDAGEPPESYVSINILNIEQQGHHSTPALTTPESILDVRVVYEVMVQFSFFGSKSGDAIHSFTQRINNNPWVLEEMSRNKLGVMRKSNSRRNPQKRDGKWIEAWNMDITYNYIINTRQEVDVVEHVVISYEDVEITIPPIEALELTTEDGTLITTEAGDTLTTEGS